MKRDCLQSRAVRIAVGKEMSASGTRSNKITLSLSITHLLKLITITNVNSDVNEYLVSVRVILSRRTAHRRTVFFSVHRSDRDFIIRHVSSKNRSIFVWEEKKKKSHRAIRRVTRYEISSGRVSTLKCVGARKQVKRFDEYRDFDKRPRRNYVWLNKKQRNLSYRGFTSVTRNRNPTY